MFLINYYSTQPIPLFYIMELTEKVDSLNRQLIDLYGVDTLTGKAMWRIVWSEDQYEKRQVNTTDEGLILIQPIIKEVPKYRNYIKERYILERLVIIPEIQQNELPVNKLSYEPMWTFMDGVGNYLPPGLLAAQFVIDAVYAVLGKQSIVKYVDPESTDPIEKRNERVNALQDELFGNETLVSDALAHRTGIVVPQNYDTKES